MELDQVQESIDALYALWSKDIMYGGGDTYRVHPAYKAWKDAVALKIRLQAHQMAQEKHAERHDKKEEPQQLTLDDLISEGGTIG
jgi:hypothetical protein